MSTMIDNDARLGRLLRLHMRGLSQRDVAEELGVSQRCVCYSLKRLGLAPHGYGTKTSKTKRSRSMREVARLKRSLQRVPVVLEADWPVITGMIPARLGYRLFASLSRLKVVSHGEEGIQILPRDDHVIVRASEERLRIIAGALPAGTALRIGGDTCRLATPVIRSICPRGKLSSWCVTVKGKTERDDFDAWLRKELHRLGVACRSHVGGRRVIKIKGLLIVGYEVTLKQLHRQEATRVLSLGLGGRRRFGCGVFVEC